MMPLLSCSNCGLIGCNHAHGRCAPCSTYLAKYGRERPEGVIVRLAKRKLEEDKARMLKAQQICGNKVFLGPDSWTECDLPPHHLGMRHRSWLGEWYWATFDLVFTRRHRLLVDLGA